MRVEKPAQIFNCILLTNPSHKSRLDPGVRKNLPHLNAEEREEIALDTTTISGLEKWITFANGVLHALVGKFICLAGILLHGGREESCFLLPLEMDL